ncbi:flagellar hook-length control protein FliK [Shewanella sp. JM162201]|uniref:Flagellar hook-length control protein FliK n=2 Tax=Shewanella jiangmenensis TaxID=2837387 RepID=A0ABS5UY61_9GAMM|nr:flagellar hook-length control protein FliK [Shewanella jiangmenensis]
MAILAQLLGAGSGHGSEHGSLDGSAVGSDDSIDIDSINIDSINIEGGDADGLNGLTTGEFTAQLAELLGMDEASLNKLDEAALQTLRLLNPGLAEALQQLADKAGASLFDGAFSAELSDVSGEKSPQFMSFNGTQEGLTPNTVAANVQSAGVNPTQTQLQTDGKPGSGALPSISETSANLAASQLAAQEGNFSLDASDDTAKSMTATDAPGRLSGVPGTNLFTNGKAADADVGLASIVGGKLGNEAQLAGGVDSKADEMMAGELKTGDIKGKASDKLDAFAALTRALGDSTSQSVTERQSAEPQRPESQSLNGFEARLNALHQKGEPMAVTLALRQAHERPTTAEIVARFAPVMNNQLIAMVRDGVQQAEIRLDPPELGSMMVRIQVQGSETQVQFHVTAAQTKDVVEQALPRLRELLAQQGMELTDGQVSHDKGQGSGRDSDAEQTASAAMDEIPAEEIPLSVNQTTSYVSGIDYYA